MSIWCLPASSLVKSGVDTSSFSSDSPFAPSVRATLALSPTVNCEKRKKNSQFRFIENVREFAERHELNSLRNSLLSQLLEKHDQNQGPSIIFRTDIQWKLGRKRVLVVLDDISDAGQLQELIGHCSLFCPGSKVISTCRDQQVLKNVCDQVYEVQELNDYESLRLIQLHAFKQRQPTPDHMDLLKEAVKYTQGLPLALVVLARNLFDKDITIWKSELAKLSHIPDMHILKILKTSFDGLEDTEKIIFLDIACVMEGWNRDHVESILDGCGFYAARGIARLVDKALITISNRHEIRMHDLIKQIGQHIASHEGIKETGRPRRLWRMNKQVVDVLTKTQKVEGTRNIEVISMDLSTVASIKLGPTVFKKLPRLRILCFHHAFTRNKNTISLPEGLEYLPDGLRYLQWDDYPSPSLPSRFNPDNLVELRMVGSNLRQLWIDEVELPSLKHVDLSGSLNLTTLPAFRNALKLEKLRASSCFNLRGLPDSIQHLVELKYIYLDNDTSITGIPECSQLTKLETLTLHNCSKIRNLPELPPSKLQLLWLSGCVELESLPNICELNHLELLNISRCPKLLTCPANLDGFKSLGGRLVDGSHLHRFLPSVTRLSSLTTLRCTGNKGDALPSLKGLVSLRRLFLADCYLKSLPEDIKYLTHLWEIDLSNCKKLSFIPELPPSLHQLDATDCTSLQKYANISLPRVDLGLGSRLRLHLIFLNVSDLEPDARNNIWRDFWLRVQFVLVPLAEEKMYGEWRTNMYPLSSETGVGRSVKAGLCVSGQNWSIVAVPGPFNEGPWQLTVTCKWLSESGENFHSEGLFTVRSLPDREHTILWCDGFSPSPYYFKEAMFRFSASVSDYNDNTGYLDLVDVAVVKCGVTPIGRKLWFPVIEDGRSPVVGERDYCPTKRERGNGDEEQPGPTRKKRKTSTSK